ncbi:MAG TPA: VPDSG-CTERM sorting domain-containing protein [Candidatus Acidoferrales bacterium]|jgi:hypothetical protein|nr:VPDSG-CTERM sorting domain-containing protein [Candidatus Acidoferrales bacterium]
MKRIFKVVAAAAAVAVVLGQSVQAVPINGEISFTGTATLNAATATGSSEVFSWANNALDQHTGTFSGLSAASSVSLLNNWFFNSGLKNSFWTVTDGLTQYKFNLSGSGVFSTTPDSITIFLAGTVIATFNGLPAPGLDPTAFTGSLTITDPGTSNPSGGFTYKQSILFNNVPDGGTTVLLLGSALSGLALIRRKLSA